MQEKLCFSMHPTTKVVGFLKNSKIKKERPEQILETYGPSNITISYLCDDFRSFQGAKIIRTLVRDGREAVAFIEYSLNNYGKMTNTPLHTYQPLKGIDFGISESVDERRILNLVTGAYHPEILWREMYNIFVVEKGTNQD